MKRLALGGMFFTSERFGETRVGDFLDTMAGYNEAELERVKSIAELIRTSTTILWNIQVGEENRLTPEELWPLRWDKAIKSEAKVLSDEEVQIGQEQQDTILLKNFPE